MAVLTNISGLTECLDDSANKFKLYMGHIHRSIGLKIRIEELFNYVTSQEGDTSVCIAMDYKMKYRPMCF